MLFKTFNKIGTWEYLRSNLGEITASEFSSPHYNQLLDRALRRGATIYSAAYILPSGKTQFGSARKHSNHLKLLAQMLADNIGERIATTKSLQQVYELLLKYPTIGPFLAFQYAIDFNYSPLSNFSEMDFVVAGPGAKSGIEKCFNMTKRWSHEDIIKLVTEDQEKQFDRRGLTFMSLWGRPLHLIDVQNLFCEIDKYSRVTFPEFTRSGGRKRLKRLFVPNTAAVSYWYPPKWGINHRVAATAKPVQPD